MTKRKKFTKSERQQIYDMFNGHCAYCGCEITLQQMQADHIEPLELGGVDEMSNLYPACRSCNHYKHTFTVERFREALKHMPDVLMRDNVTYRNAVRFGLIKHPENPKVEFYFEKVRNNDNLTHESKDYSESYINAIDYQAREDYWLG